MDHCANAVNVLLANEPTICPCEVSHSNRVPSPVMETFSAEVKKSDLVSLVEHVVLVRAEFEKEISFAA